MAEHHDQSDFISWCLINEQRLPPLTMIYANVNGAWTKNLGEARKLKREGLKSGVPDLFLAFPTRRYSGFFIEMKYGKNTTSVSQVKWLKKLAAVGYKCKVVYGRENAIKQTLLYLNEDYDIKINEDLIVISSQKKLKGFK